MYEDPGDLTVMLITSWWFTKVRERLAVSKQTPQKFEVERFNLRKPNEVEIGRLKRGLQFRSTYVMTRT
jgi:hypothetical protein